MRLVYLIKNLNKNKKKIIISNKYSDKSELDQSKNKEVNLTHLSVANTIFIIILRVPEMVFSIKYLFLHKVVNSRSNLLCDYVECSDIMDWFDFLFPLNGVLQFCLFYTFNNNFKESFNSIFL